MKNPGRFVHLHVHSHFSFCRGVDGLRELCRAARARGMDSLAVTDTNGLYGLIWFLQFAREEGIRPIVGAEAVWGGEQAVVLVRNGEGYAGLCRLLSNLHKAAGPTVGSEGCPSNAPAPFDLGRALVDLPPGVVILTRSTRLLERLAIHRGTQDLYGELRPDLAPMERSRLKRFLKDHGLPPVATAAACFAHREGHRTHRLLRAIATNSTLASFRGGDPPGTAPPDCWLADPRVMEGRHPDQPEAMANSRRIADACRFTPELGKPIFPAYVTADGSDPAALLEQLCLEGAYRRYGGVGEPVRLRLNHEMAIIRDKGFSPYFLVVRDIVAQAPRTCGRGSAAASLVSYLLGITHVDPIRHDLYFERFLHHGRSDPPDIDVDFPWDERDDVLNWVFEHFGEGQVAMIANHCTLRTRAAVRETAKVLGLPNAEIGRVCKRFPWHADDPMEVVRKHPRFRGMELGEPWPEVFRLAMTVQGTPRNLSVHCGGVVIVPGGVDQVVPVQPTPKGLPVVQWEKDQAEDAGLVKIDLLGNRSLAVIRDACREVGDHGGEAIDFHRFDPTEDPETCDMVARGETMGVFYVESPAMRQLQLKCGKGDFEHLVIHSSIIRPAANVYIQEYIRRLKGGSWEPLHPALDHVLRETYGIMVYQEDVSRAAIALAGFDAGSADELRKVMSKKHKAAKLADYRDRFIDGARRRGIGDDAIGKIWDMMLSFSGYSFCKPHSASYAMVSFQSAYLRAHHPAEFMAAVISNQGGYYATFAYVSEAKRMGLTVLPPCVNRSMKHWTGRNDAIRVGLMQLQGFPDAARKHLLEERERSGRYRDFDDLLQRTGDACGPEAVRTLILAGTCDGLLPAGGNRADLAWKLAAWERSRERTPAAVNLFSSQSTEPQLPSRLPRMGRYDDKALLEHEVRTLGFLVSRHPLTLYADVIRKAKAVPARDLNRHVGRRVTLVGWYVTGKPVMTKHGEAMEFLSFEDTTALYETTFFPRAYDRFCSMISRHRPYFLTGRVEENYGVATLNVDQVRPVDRTPDA